MTEIKVQPRIYLTISGPLLVLNEIEGQRFLHISISSYDSDIISIAFLEQNTQFQTPHDVIIEMIRILGLKTEKAVIKKLENDSCYAQINLQKGNEAILLSARPSDAVIVALRTNCPIFVDENIINDFTKSSMTACGSMGLNMESWLANLDVNTLIRH